MVVEENVRLVKLPTGEEVVGEVTGGSNEKITIKNCIMFMPQRDEMGRVNISPAHYPVFSEESESLTFTPVYVCRPAQKIIEAYKQIFSPIIEAPASALEGLRLYNPTD